MRVEFGNHIDLCKRITYSGGTLLIITTIYDAIYIVDCKAKEIAAIYYEKLLTDGWIDASELDYHN